MHLRRPRSLCDADPFPNLRRAGADGCGANPLEWDRYADAVGLDPEGTPRHIPALIRPLPDGRFRASAFDVSADGPTPEGAVEALKGRLRPLLDEAPRIMDFEMHVPGEEHPFLKYAGIFQDDPLFDEWQRAIEENRRRADEDPSIP